MTTTTTTKTTESKAKLSVIGQLIDAKLITR